MKQLQSRSLFLWCSILLLFAALGTEAQRADGMNLAVGMWNVSIQTNNPSRFFFPVQNQTRFVDSGNKNFSPQMQIFPRLFRSSFCCTLMMLPDGSFFMKPRPQKNKKDECGDIPGESLLNLRGRWTLERNPYCATDRFFDVLHLKSYPQVALDAASGQVFHRRSLTWHARLYGHYNRQPGLSPARIERGVCLFQQHDAESHENKKHKYNNEATHRPITFSVRLSNALRDFWSQQRDPVVASFTATKTKL